MYFSTPKSTLFLPFIAYVFACGVIHAQAKDQIVYITKRDGNFEIYRCDAEGKTHTRLTENPGMDWSPNWNEKLKGLVYYSNSPVNGFKIRLMDTDGKQKSIDTKKLEEFILSPDGAKVAINKKVDDFNQIFIVDLATGSEFQMTTTAAYNGRHTWSPDGTRIAFISDRTGSNELFMCDLETKFVTRLTTNKQREKYASWSPDGNQIAFTKCPENGTEDIYILDLKTGKQSRVTNNEFVDAEISWSPDGTTIAFHSTRNGQDHIFVINPDGTDEKQVTTVNAYHGEPSWIPQNAFIR